MSTVFIRHMLSSVLPALMCYKRYTQMSTLMDSSLHQTALCSGPTYRGGVNVGFSLQALLPVHCWCDMMPC